MNSALLYTMLIGGCVLGAFASYFFKNASSSIDGLKIGALLKERGLWIGAALYLVAAANNIFLLRYMEYSIILPMSSITYIWTMVIANKLLHERVTRRKVIGICAIIAGAVLLARG
ncbi:MAG: EamA family transporter [Clostridiales Family XIII bacterium]|jgi:drug/metabolite transporter (DMT)-like permease|nr:EamA family transporter [Clostridiales Family XIII bacterium]